MPRLDCLSFPLAQFHSAETGACLLSARECLGDKKTTIFLVEVQRYPSCFFRSVLSTFWGNAPKKPGQQVSKCKAGHQKQNQHHGFLLLSVCNTQDRLLRMSQCERLSLDFILVRGHASLSRRSREKPGWSSLLCLPLSLQSFLTLSDLQTCAHSHSLVLCQSWLHREKQLNRLPICSHWISTQIWCILRDRQCFVMISILQNDTFGSLKKQQPIRGSPLQLTPNKRYLWD